ncbi:MAG: hypothetical protein OXU61_01160 [Gammaproteobacteria bacterium]|nr:hypothetical protein [Gammaproteobacteria bacterium]
MGHPKHVRDNRANQLNPQRPVYHRGRGASTRQAVNAAKSARNNAKPPKKPG